MRQHPSLSKNSKKNILLPHYIAHSVHDIDFQYLKKMGIKACLIDLDDTIVTRDSLVIDNQTASLLKQISLPIYIASNRPKDKNLSALAKQIKARGIIQPEGILGKPSRSYFQQAMNISGQSPSDLLMIGDHLLQDIYGANRSGLKTVAVSKYGEVKLKHKPAAWIDNLVLYFLAERYVALDKI